MNPASILLNQTNLDSGLISIASKCGQGKTLVCNSFVEQLAYQGFNVILFTENRIKFRDKNNLKGVYICDFGHSSEDIFKFHNIINHYFFSMSGKIALIIDSPEFITNSNFELYYEKLKENTRYVLTEKNKGIEYRIERIENKPHYEKIRQNVESLLCLSRKFNIPIVTTTQFKKTIDQFGNQRAEILEINRNLAHTSNLVIGVQKIHNLKNDNINFEIKVLKSRFSSENNKINCIFDNKSCSLVTN